MTDEKSKSLTNGGNDRTCLKAVGSDSGTGGRRRGSEREEGREGSE